MKKLPDTLNTGRRAAIKNPDDYTASSNLMWEAAMAENRIIRLGWICWIISY